MRTLLFLFLMCCIAALCSCNGKNVCDSYRWNEKMRWTRFMQDSVKPKIFELKVKILIRDIDTYEIQKRLDTIYNLVDIKFIQ